MKGKCERFINRKKGGGQMFYRNSKVLWRSNDDQTVLLLNSMTGNAYLLCPSMSRIWIALENGIPEAQVNKFGLTCDESFMAAVNNLLDKGLINHVAVESACFEKTDFFQGLSGPYTIDEIAFGGCECTAGTGNRGGQRNSQCPPEGNLRFTMSTTLT